MDVQRRGIPLILMVLALWLSGCSLSSLTPLVTPTEPPSSLPERPASSFIDLRSSSGADAGDAPAAAQPQIVVQSVIVNQPVYVIAPMCALRYDWPHYVVRYGDTLARIAAYYRTTVETLAYANCLSNPNLIYAGQALRVPYAYPVPAPYHPYPPHPHHPPYPPPVYPTAAPLPTLPPPTAIPPIIIGTALSISSYAAVNGTVYTLNPDELITIRWESAFPAAARQVAFELIAPTGGAQVIGIDSNLGDGASILWRTVTGVQGTLRGIASFYDGYAPQGSDAYYVIVP
ncbi:MAG: LysM peptidoglycan-binding domain-containing protein [Anaerolineae bacterium]|nr:LysM peptidoglycan-binding domain-containing protein [Anaerolineae bacterium]